MIKPFFSLSDFEFESLFSFFGLFDFELEALFESLLSLPIFSLGRAGPLLPFDIAYHRAPDE
jgi:hypothetical protein